MRLGIDLDNTIIYYDEAFAKAAMERGLLDADFKGTKQQLRDAIRKLDDGETKWQALQGYVYGKGLIHASLFPGLAEFLSEAAKAGHELFIVSHKTELGHFDPDKINLRIAAKAWLKTSGVLAHIGEAKIHFASTREDKVELIAKLSLDWFIDDLVEVYEEPGFPKSVRKILLHSNPGILPQGDWIVCKNWNEINSVIASAAKQSIRLRQGFGGRGWIATSPLAPRDDEIERIAERLLKTPIDSISQIGGGGNSRIYKITADGRNYALKQYPTIENDQRNRLGVERQALELFAAHAIKITPRWLAGVAPFALLEWIEGMPVTSITNRDIDDALSFLHSIFALPHDGLPHASEACLSGIEILRQIDTRLKRLRDVPELTEFLNDAFLPALNTREKNAAALIDLAHELPVPEQKPIPADFGFHNAMRTKTGLAFIDFEYFGLDDPVKLIADFLLHPAYCLSSAQKQRFYNGMVTPPLEKRFLAFYPLFGLRWALILLNEFLPERWQARAKAKGESDWQDAKRRQLAKAREMLTISDTWQ